jgi:acid stress chaperone HdeB
MMALFGGVAFVAAAVFVADRAHAQALDLAALKCKEFIQLPKDTTMAVTMWLDGHLTDEDDPPVLDLDRIREKADRLATFCAQSPEVGLLSAAEDIISK